MKNWYWRKDSFEGLQKVIELSIVNSEWELYSKYCELKEKGLRKQAFKTLSEFIKHLNKKSLTERIEFVNWIEERRLKNNEVVDLIPNPLQKKLIEPTLKDWIKSEPNNPIPYRWTNTNESLLTAIKLDDKEQIARFRFFQKIKSYIDYNQHELEKFQYIGNPEKDLEQLRSLKEHIQGIENPEQIFEEINALIEICKQYIEFEKDEMFGNGNFIPFMKKRNPNFNYDKYL